MGGGWFCISTNSYAENRSSTIFGEEHNNLPSSFVVISWRSSPQGEPSEIGTPWRRTVTRRGVVGGGGRRRDGSGGQEVGFSLDSTLVPILRDKTIDAFKLNWYGSFRIRHLY